MSTPETQPVFTRPTSPHLQIYKLPLTAAIMSITHRITGLALVAGSLLLVVWLSAAAYSPGCFNGMHEFFGGIIGKLLLFGWTLAFYYHLLNGIRHLFWDIGRGFELETAERSGYMVLLGCSALTVITWIVAFSGGAGA